MTTLLCLLMLTAQAPVDAIPESRPTARPDPTTLRLQRGLELLQRHEIEEARAELELALQDGPYRYAQVVDLYRGLGIARAYAGDEDGARQAFARLLVIAPGHVLRYTLSPKATFVFEQTRQEQRTRRALELRIESAPVIAFDAPVELVLTRVADPDLLITRVLLYHRLKGDAAWQSVEVAPPPVDGEVRVSLPAIPAARAVEDADGTRGAVLQIAIEGYDASRWQIYRGPPPEQPREAPVGFDVPGPWYTQWWLWGLGGAVAAAAATGVVLAVLLRPIPDEVHTTYQVLP